MPWEYVWGLEVINIAQLHITAIANILLLLTSIMSFLRALLCALIRVENLQTFSWICDHITITVLQFRRCMSCIYWFPFTVRKAFIFSASSPKAPSAPSFIHFSELTTTSVNVSWGEPKQPNGIIEGYRLVYEPCTPVDGEKPCLVLYTAPLCCGVPCLACLTVIYNSLSSYFIVFNLHCLSSPSNLLQVANKPCSSIYGMADNKICRNAVVGLHSFVPGRNMANSWLNAAAWTGLTSNWEQTWNSKLRLLWSLDCPLTDPGQGKTEQ